MSDDDPIGAATWHVHDMWMRPHDEARRPRGHDRDAGFRPSERPKPRPAIRIAASICMWLLTWTSTSADVPGLGAVEETEDVITRVIERSLEAVVTIQARNILVPTRVPDFFREIPHTGGTGFIFHPDGYVVTNDHTIHEATDVSVKLFDDRRLDARVVGSDPNTDIAVLKLDADGPFPMLPLGDSDAAKVGQFVISIGNPFSLSYSANLGIVSAKGRSVLPPRVRSGTLRYQDFIQTNAYMNRGSSGGPLVNLRGDVVGMNTLIPTAEDQKYAGIGFAVSSNILRAITAQLIEKGRVDRSWLGVHMRAIEDGPGIRISRVLPKSPADRGGVKPGDVVTRIDGRTLADADEDTTREFGWIIASTPVGHRVRLSIVRDGAPLTLDIELGAMPAREAGREPYPVLAKVGLRVQSFYTEVAHLYELSEEDTGVLILRVKRGSLAHEAGLGPYELVSQVDGEAVGTPAELEASLRKAIADQQTSVRFAVKVADSERDVSLHLSQLLGVD